MVGACASGVAGPLAAWCSGQICRHIVLGLGKWIAFLICDSCQFSRYVSDLIQYSHIWKMLGYTD